MTGKPRSYRPLMHGQPGTPPRTSATTTDPAVELDPHEWATRPRGEACPECAALIGYSTQFEQDKATHAKWHSDIERFHVKVMLAFEALAAPGLLETIIAAKLPPAPEPKE